MKKAGLAAATQKYERVFGLSSKVRRHRSDALKFYSDVDQALKEIQQKLNVLAKHTMLPDDVEAAEDEQ